eukprot:1156368-Pelagomonas_calceolata.AAC.1
MSAQHVRNSLRTSAHTHTHACEPALALTHSVLPCCVSPPQGVPHRTVSPNQSNSWMQQAAEQRPLPCHVSPLSYSITSAEPCMLMPPRQERSRQQHRRWWQQRLHDNSQQGSDEHSTEPAVGVTKDAAGREGDPVDEEAAAQSTCLSVGAWVRAPPNVHLQGWDPAQGSLEQCCTAACGTTEGGEPMLRVLACTSVGYLPTQVSLTQIRSSIGGGAGNSCGSSDRNSPDLEEQLSTTRLDCSSADGTELFKVRG